MQIRARHVESRYPITQTPAATTAAAASARLVLFDIDGTLVSTGGAGMRSFGEAFEAAFGVADATAKIKFAGRTDYSLFREMCRHADVDHTPENRELFFSHYLRLVDNHLDASKGGPFPGVVSLLDELTALPTAPVLGLLTGNIREGAKRKLGAYGLWDRFALGGFSDDDEDRNLIAAAAADKGGVYLEQQLCGTEIVVIGDTPRDIACGKHIGARTVGVATGGATLETLRACEPDWAVADLTHLSARDVCGD